MRKERNGRSVTSDQEKAQEVELGAVGSGGPIWYTYTLNLVNNDGWNIIMVGNNLKRVHTAIFTIFSFWVKMVPRIGLCLMFQIEEIMYDVVSGFLRDNLAKVRDSGLSRERESRP